MKHRTSTDGTPTQHAVTLSAEQAQILHLIKHGAGMEEVRSRTGLSAQQIEAATGPVRGGPQGERSQPGDLLTKGQRYDIATRQMEWQAVLSEAGKDAIERYDSARITDMLSTTPPQEHAPDAAAQAELGEQLLEWWNSRAGGQTPESEAFDLTSQLTPGGLSALLNRWPEGARLLTPAEATFMLELGATLPHSEATTSALGQRASCEATDAEIRRDRTSAEILNVHCRVLLADTSFYEKVYASTPMMREIKGSIEGVRTPPPSAAQVDDLKQTGPWLRPLRLSVSVASALSASVAWAVAADETEIGKKIAMWKTRRFPQADRNISPNPSASPEELRDHARRQTPGAPVHVCVASPLSSQDMDIADHRLMIMSTIFTQQTLARTSQRQEE